MVLIPETDRGVLEAAAADVDGLIIDKVFRSPTGKVHAAWSYDFIRNRYSGTLCGSIRPSDCVAVEPDDISCAICWRVLMDALERPTNSEEANE